MSVPRYQTSAVGGHGFSQRPLDRQYTTSTKLCPGGAGGLPKVMVNTGSKQRDNTEGLQGRTDSDLAPPCPTQGRLRGQN